MWRDLFMGFSTTYLWASSLCSKWSIDLTKVFLIHVSTQLLSLVLMHYSNNYHIPDNTNIGIYKLLGLLV